MSADGCTTGSSDPMFVFAFTALKNPYPEYINVTRLDNGDAKITIRGESTFWSNDDGHRLPKPGETVEIILPVQVYEIMIRAAAGKL